MKAPQSLPHRPSTGAHADNPLPGHHDVVPYHLIKAEHVEPAVMQVINDNLRQLADILPAQVLAPTWEGLVQPLEDMQQRLLAVLQPEQLLARHHHLDVVQAYERCRGRVRDYESAMQHNPTLHAALHRLQQSAHAAGLDRTQRAALEQALRTARLAGTGLEKSVQLRVQHLSLQLESLYAQFSSQVQQASEGWSLAIDDQAMLAGVAPAVLEALALNARDQGRDGWLLTLDFNLVLAVLTQAHDRSLRERVYAAYYTLASDQGPRAGEHDNTPIIERILRTRTALAETLGYRSYASLAQATRMFDDPRDVEHMLLTLLDKVRPKAQREVQQVKDLAALFGIATLQPWDFHYYQEKFLQIAHGVADLKVREYFSVQSVLDGVRTLIAELFNVHWVECAPAPRQPSTVRLIKLSENGRDLGYIYLDLHQRPKKRSGAWMEALRDRHRFADGRLQLPIAHISCDFAAESGQYPTSLSLSDIRTLLHELGHALHHVMTLVEHGSVAGIKGVAEDAVELPSVLFEQWALQPQTLVSMSSHFKTGAAVPMPFLSSALAAKVQFSAQLLVWQLEYALVDHRLHTGSDPSEAHQIARQVMLYSDVLPHASYARWLNTFAHLFTTSDYAGGYYTYAWSQVLAADMFGRFKGGGVPPGEPGADLRDLVLASGGTRPMAELVESFSRRKPTIDALLRELDITP